MSIPPELEAQILRYYHVEKWRTGTIARHLGVHHGSVERVLAQAGLPSIRAVQRASQIDVYLPFVHQTLERFPTLTASRLYIMVRERGYHGGPDHFRHLIGRFRPQRKAEAYLRLRTLPGEQGQVDWGHFGHLNIGRARRPLMAFVMVLSYSRQIFLHFCLDARMESFLRGHLGAFAAWSGLPRVLLYDNLKSVVLQRHASAIRFHPTLLEFAGHYRFEPRPVAPARGNEKGRVERAIRYVRENFFAARTYADLDDLNDYSIPHTHVGQWLTLLADPRQVRITHAEQVLACHARSYDRGAQIENPAHVQALVDHKRGARHHRGADRLSHAAPASRELLIRAAARGENLGAITAALLRLLDRYGGAELEAAMRDAIERGVPHPNAVRLALERRREQRRAPPPVAVCLPNHVKDRDSAVRPHRLDTYDQLTGEDDEQP